MAQSAAETVPLGGEEGGGRGTGGGGGGEWGGREGGRGEGAVCEELEATTGSCGCHGDGLHLHPPCHGFVLTNILSGGMTFA